VKQIGSIIAKNDFIVTIILRQLFQILRGAQEAHTQDRRRKPIS